MGLLFSEDLSDASLPRIPPNRARIRFSAHHDSDHGLCLGPLRLVFAASVSPQVKKLPASKPPLLDEVFKGCLPADTLIRAEPLLWLQRLYLGQLFPALFPAPRKDFSSPCGFGAGKKAVLITTFSFGRLICSFHEAGIIVKFFWNSKPFFKQVLFFLWPVRSNDFLVIFL